MAATQEGTGKHPHKSAAEPHEHHEAPTSKGKDAQHESSASHSTGSHTSSASHSTGSHKETASHSEGSPSTGKSADDLESRAYTGPDGQEHHHTTKYAEQHKGDK